METPSIKALAIAVVERNHKGNQTETRGFHEGDSKQGNGNYGKLAQRIYSHVLGAFLWVVSDDEQADILRASGEAKEPIYTMRECRELNKVNKNELAPIHMVKQVFPGARVERVG